MPISRRTLTALAGAATLAAALGACGAEVQVNTDWNPNVDFQQYKTFAFLPDTVDKSLPPFANDRIKAAIDSALKKRGLTETTSDPQLYVTYRANQHSETQYTTVSSGYGYGAGWGGWGGYGYGGYYGGMGYGGVGVSTTTQQQIPFGNLIVVLVDTKLNEMVWRGNAKAEIAEDMQGRAQQLESAMNQMFYNFPPKKGQQPGSTEY
jgi:hypothetical protein